MITKPAIVAMKARMTTKKSTMLCHDGQLKKTFGVNTIMRRITLKFTSIQFLKVDLNHLDYEIYRYQKIDMTNDDANRMSRATDCNLGHD